MIIRCYFDPANGPSRQLAADIKSANPSAIIYSVSPGMPFPEAPSAIEGKCSRLFSGLPGIFIDTDDGLQEHTRLEAGGVSLAAVNAEVAAVSGGQRPPYAIPIESTTTHPFADSGNMMGQLSGKAETTDPRFSDARAPLAHGHDASDIISGQLAMARIASGTPDGTKFVGDDGMLRTPSGGGGGLSQAQVLARSFLKC
jgi:hypothetical protein